MKADLFLRPAASLASCAVQRIGWILFLSMFLWASHLTAQPAPPKNGGPLDSWSFKNTTNWTDDFGDAPMSFTNLSVAPYGNGNALVVDRTNEAWLQFAVFQDGYTNMTVNNGTVMFWFGSDWASTSLGGTGPGIPYGPLFETGYYTSNANVGWWSIYIDQWGSNVYFSAQTNTGVQTNYVSARIAWTNDVFHLVAVTYSSTNTELYLDGTNAATGPAMTIYPNNTILSNGFWIGGASNGLAQSHGQMSQVLTYNYALDSNTIYSAYLVSSVFYGPPDGNISQAPSTPDAIPAFDAVTGPGYLELVNSNSGCGNNSNVWITNTVAVLTNGAVNLTFTIAGGSNGLPYDVFATPELAQPLTNGIWSWMGAGYQCCTYTIPSLTNTGVFLMLGTFQDSYGNGLTDAYELLVLHQNPADGSHSGDGMLDGWKVLWGMNPLVNNSAQPSERANYTYDGTGRLETNSGVTFSGFSPEIFSFDAEGNTLNDQP